MKATTMEKIASSQFRDDFGRVMDSVQHASITITKRGRDYATLFSQKKIEDTAKELLWDYSRKLVESGEMDILEALIFQSRVKKDIETANVQYENGEYYEATDEFFASFKTRAMALADNPK